MTTSTPASTSKNSADCRCSKDCGCCTRKAREQVPTPAPGFLAKRPWIWVFVAFGIMFSAWTVMFSLAMKNQPEVVPMVVNAAE